MNELAGSGERAASRAAVDHQAVPGSTAASDEPAGPDGAGRDAAGRPGGRRRRLSPGLIRRLVFLGLGAVGLYVVWPSLWDVFASWPELGRIEPFWFAGMMAAIAASAVCVWWQYRLVMHVHGWYLIATAQLSAAAFGKIVPGGAASGGALQFTMLTQGGIRGGRVASGITAVSIISGATVLALPLFALPALVGVFDIESTLRRVALFGLGVLAVLLGFSILMLLVDHPLHWAGRGLDWIRGKVLHHPTRHPDIADRLLAERDIVRDVLGQNWRAALAAALGQRGLDFAALLMAVYGTGTELNPLLVLLAYGVAQILTIVPITPGGLGFVEVGLVGFLGFAGMETGAALVATLAYRLVAYWLPMLAGAVAYGLYVHRYGRAVLPGSGAPDDSQGAMDGERGTVTT